MSEPTFEIIFRGKILKDFDRATVRRNLAQLFRTDEARIEVMLDQPKLVLKRGLSRAAAQQMQETLRGAGIMVAATPEATAAAAAPAPAPVAAAATPAVATPAPVTMPAPVAAAEAPTGITLAPVGAPVLERVIKPVAREYNLSGLKLDAPGVVLAEARRPPPPKIDTSLLELAPIEEPVEQGPSELTRKLFAE